jgi:hypothetical protein
VNTNISAEDVASFFEVQVAKKLDTQTQGEEERGQSPLRVYRSEYRKLIKMDLFTNLLLIFTLGTWNWEKGRSSVTLTIREEIRP